MNLALRIAAAVLSVPPDVLAPMVCGVTSSYIFIAMHADQTHHLYPTHAIPSAYYLSDVTGPHDGPAAPKYSRI